MTAATHTTAPSNDLTEIAVVLDRSGSMSSIKDDMEGGLWTTITEQHGQPGRCRVSLYQFDDLWEPAFEGTPSGDITQENCRLVPRGSTALNDAVVKSLAAIEARILGEPEDKRPGKVAVVVITDGHENASKENKKQDVRDAIGRATDKFGWKFVFLAADEDGFAEGRAMTKGFVGTAAASYDAGNVRGMYAGTSEALSDFRAGRADIVDLQGKPLGKKDSDDDDSSGGGPKVH
jgi:hypothetical protein